jgi:hypothetical protein
MSTSISSRLLAVADEHTMVADHVDDAWNPGRVLGDRRTARSVNRLRSGRPRSAAGYGCSPASPPAVRRNGAMQADPLPKLPELGTARWASSSGRPRGRSATASRSCLEVGQEPDSARGGRIQVLRFVDDHDRVHAPRDAARSGSDSAREALHPGVTGLGDPKSWSMYSRSSSNGGSS